MLSVVFRRRAPAQSPDKSTPDTFLTEAFWIVLGRAPKDDERAMFRTHQAAGGEALVLEHLLNSPEFHLIVTFWRDDIGIPGDPVAHEEGLRALGASDHFVRLAYRLLLGREADEAGLANYVAVLAAGESRRMVVRTLITSGEFDARYKPIVAHEGGYVPRDVQLCELANPAKWDNPDWIRILKSLQVPHHKLSMHRKSYEWTQLLFGLKRLGKIDEATSVLSVGAGHECVLYWLANHTGRVVATDLYEGRWQSSAGREGDVGVLEHPEEFAPFPYRKDRLTFRRMDGRTLQFADHEFDVVYSLSSIEHFGGFDGARASMVEMARVLKPGGVLVLATEYIVCGPDYEEAFQPDVFKRLIDVPGLRLVEPIDECVARRYDTPVVNLRTHLHQRPHMLVKVDDTVFTSAMVFLRRL
ncbi:MAG TPA: methyltransferase domain-containing protein, partial [Vicinamibacterales bacterium]|nr:methyltransferase domain-containing protein [Vicinamibacterales bacterium]